MAYVVYTSSGTFLTSIPTGAVNTSASSLSLIGKDVIGYGQYYNQNLISMLTNFSNSIAPSNAIQGQLWYDAGLNKLKVYNNGWSAVRAFSSSRAIPTGQETGEFWYDSINKNLNFNVSGQYYAVTSFPRNNISGWQAPLVPITDNVGNVKQVTILQNSGQTIGAISTSSFTVSPQQSTSTFLLANTSTVKLTSGLSIIGNIEATGSFISLGTPPTSSISVGTTGQIAWGQGYNTSTYYVFVCIAPNSWQRAALTSF